MKIGSWTQLSKKLKYQTPWLQVYHHEVINPAGNESIYGTVEFQNLAIGILAIDDDWNTYLVKQFRYPLKAYSWEIPEGGCPIDKSTPLLTAHKELREEAGLVAQKMELIMELDMSNSATNEQAYIYLARELEFVSQELEDSEDITLLKLSFDKALEMALNGEIRDAISVAAILKLAYLRNNNLII